MNKKISQFEITNVLNDHDILTLVQSKENRNIAISDFNTNLSKTFATNEQVADLGDGLDELETKVDDNYADLSEKIVTGDKTVTSNLSSTINSYYDVLNNSIIKLEEKHDKDMNEANGTIQEWIDDIDNRSTLEQLQDALNRLTVAENTITSLAEIIANGGGSGSAPGYHTQATSTIFPLSGYYKSTSAAPLATTDTLNQALSKLENQIEAVSSSSGSLPVIKYGESTPPSDSHLYTSLKVAEDYLNKHGDTADGKITFLDGLQAGETFRQGWDGVGASLYPLGSKWNFEVDNLFVRGNMTVNELVVNEIKAVGGDILVTLGDMKCTQVVELADSYQCFFDNQDGTKYNSFRANDMAICQKFDGKNAKRYWRKVNEVGDDCIYLSKDVCEPGSAKPEAEDEILQLGHMYESDPDYNLQMDERRNAIFISAKGANAPRISFYKNIDTFSLSDEDGVVRERVVIGGNETKFIGTMYQTSDTGIIRVPVYKGVWVAGNTYYYYDQVTHNGSLWICMDPNGTTDEPTEDDDQWQKQVSKGDAGQAGDDVAKWVEITGDRLYLYDSPDYTGVPNPSAVNLTANVYGMENPTYEWTTLDEANTTISYQNAVSIPHTFFSTRTFNLRCTVTNSDGTTYYDDVQLAKLANGAEGLDAYYIDLSNGTAAIPYSADGNTPGVSLDTIKTLVYAYHGIEPITIQNITYSVSSGTATVTISGNSVKLATLDTDKANIDLQITLADGVSVTKTWYVSKVKNGEDGWNGEDAAYVYMSGEQFFHYKSGATIPEPTSITITADSFNILNPTYKWYWSIAGMYDWQLLANETANKLVVSYNGVYFTSTGKDEISFKCEVIGDGSSYSDFMTINKVRDGENVYRAILTNENTSVPASSTGVVSDYSSASTEARLRYGSTEYTNFKLTTTLLKGSGSVSYTSSTRILKCTSLSSDVAVWRADFYYPSSGTDSKVVDSVDFTVSKSKAGSDGEAGTSSLNIYCVKSSQPSRPSLTYRPTSSGATSNGTVWYPDAKYSSSSKTWVSTGSYDAKTDSVVYDSAIGGYWTYPVPHTGLDGADGANGAQGPQGPAGSPGADGADGPALSYRGEYSSSKQYGWTEKPAVRDVVKSGSTWYMVSESRKGAGLFYNKPVSNTSYWTAFTNNFESVATGLLFAETASIASWNFDDELIWSNTGNVGLYGAETGYVPVMAFGQGSYPGTIEENGIRKTNSNAAIVFYKSGEIWVGQGTKTAGMIGNNTTASYNGSPVRFFAGGAPTTASFIVNDAGEVYAKNGHFTGEITCKSLTVGSGDRANYGGPGVKCIAFINNTSTGNNANNTLTEVYSVDGVHLSKSGSSSGGYTSFNLTGISNKNYIVVCGSQGTGGLGMRGSYGCGSQTASGFTILSIDTDNKNHNLHGNYIAILTY